MKWAPIRYVELSFFIWPIASTTFSMGESMVLHFWAKPELYGCLFIFTVQKKLWHLSIRSFYKNAITLIPHRKSVNAADPCFRSIAVHPAVQMKLSIIILFS